DVALGDLDGDTQLDVVFANSDGTEGAKNRVCFGDGTGQFSCADIDANTDRSYGVAIGDIDKDGDLEVVFATNNISDKRNRACFRKEGEKSREFSCENVGNSTKRSYDVSL
ncbi:MAG: VCBS repeat-containing protein, partial [Pseudomonadota bacterium]|nr:VCBS repeat-containing protein [Pseudomonadota bacterium]